MNEHLEGMTDRARGVIAVAMSGGVDSSVAAALLKDQDYEVVGVTAIMSPGFSRCCAEEDVRTAQAVSRQLGIPHHVIDVSQDFQREVVDYFACEYLAGRTPSPCVRCNRLIKFGALMQAALGLGAARLATGHYARIFPDGPERRLLRGRDPHKDQSYFLAMLTQDQLRHVCFPLGEMTKERVMQLAQTRQLAARHSKESQELCFIDTEDHGTWIDVRRLDTRGPGDIVDAGGVKLGEHRGIHHYTIGQRRGLGVATGTPAYVIALDAGRNRVVVGERAQAMRSRMRVSGLSWIAGTPPPAEVRTRVQIRYHHTAAPAQVHVEPEGTAAVEFDEPQFAITPGQLAAFYEDDAVLGGGWIEAE